MRVAIFNVKFSPNIGDGLLCECLEAEMTSQASDIEIMVFDLAGRGTYGEGALRRSIMLTVLAIAPRSLRRAVAGFVLTRLVKNRLKPAWKQRLTQADVAIVGGGNLFADADLNFPIKIAGALSACAEAGLPVSIHAVGVSDNWSRRGARHFLEGLAASNLIGVTVRDERSRTVWRRRVTGPEFPTVGIGFDPGLLAGLHFPQDVARIPEGYAVGSRHIGLNVTNPAALRYHADHAIGAAMDTWLTELVESFLAQGWSLSLYTNGSPEDRLYLRTIQTRMTALGPGRVRIERPFRKPAELAALVARCDLLIGHRMHSSIAAYAYRRPHIGLVWDAKLDSFFAYTERSRYLIDPIHVSPQATTDLAIAAMAEGICGKVHARIVLECRAGVTSLIAGLRRAHGNRAARTAPP